MKSVSKGFKRRVHSNIEKTVRGKAVADSKLVHRSPIITVTRRRWIVDH